MKSIQTLIILFFISSFTEAKVRTWIGAGAGGTSSNFNLRTNWQPAGNPNNDDLIIVMTSAATIEVTSSITIKSIYMEANVGSGISYCRLDLGSGSNVLTVKKSATFDAINYSYFFGVNDVVELDAGSSGSKFIFKGNNIFHNGGGGDVHFEADISNPGDIVLRNDADFNYYTYTSPGDEPNFVFDASGTQEISLNTNTSYVMGESITFGDNNSPTVEFDGSNGFRMNVYEKNLTIGSNTTVEMLNGSLDVFLVADPARTFTMGSEATLIIGGTGTFPGDNFFNDYASYNMDPTSTVRYSGGNQTIKGTSLNYPNLVLEGTGIKTSGYNFSIQGDFINNATFVHGNDEHTFNGTGDQRITGSGTTTFYQVEVNKPTGTLSLDANTVVDQRLNLVDGPLDLNGFNLTVNSDFLNSIRRTNGYIISETNDMSSSLTKNIGTTPGAHLFPFGKRDGTYIPFYYRRVASDQGYVTVSTYNTSADNLPYPTGVTNANLSRGIDYSASTVDRYWNVIGTGTTNANLTFTYAEDEAPVTGEGHMMGQWWNNGSAAWEDALVSVSSQTNDAGANTVTANGVTVSNGMWALSTEGLLPLDLLSFTVEKMINNKGKIEWVTANEINLSHFKVQKSVDGKTFYDLTTVQAKGEGSNKTYYNYVDNKLSSGKNYYRLVLVNDDGSFEYSKIEMITNLENTFSAYPNPATDVFYVSYHNEAPSFKLINSIGQEVKVDYTNANKVIRFDVSDLPSGIYFLNIETSVERIVIR